MGKWIAGVLGAVVTGAVVWLLTNAVFPRFLREESPPPPDRIAVECSPEPHTVPPGGTTELTVKVTRNGAPVEGAAVIFRPEEATVPARTASGGILRVPWTAPNPAASSYVFPVNVDLAGIRTSEGELQGTATTNCQVMVR